MPSFFQKFTATINSWIGKNVDFDKAYGSQCVDFARQYASDMGSPIGTFSGSAINGWTTGSPFVKTKWRRVEYKKFKPLVPNTGDIVFFAKTLANPYGHVAVVDVGSTANKISVIEQNAGRASGTGKGTDAITKRSYTYTNAPVGNVLGWYTIQS